jgi:hypothetical protein
MFLVELIRFADPSEIAVSLANVNFPIPLLSLDVQEWSERLVRCVFILD